MGYVIIGVSDKPETALRVKELFGVEPILFGGFQVTGVEHEAQYVDKNPDKPFQLVTDKIRSSELTEPLHPYINSHMKYVSYFDKTAFVFEVKGQGKPSLHRKKHFERQGTQVFKVEPENLSSLFSRFN